MTEAERSDTDEIDVERAVTLTDRLIRQHTGRHLSAVQMAVFREAWLGTRKTYSQLAQETQYSANYVQQVVGPKLWRLLSKITGDKVTKRTVNISLSTYFTDQGVQQEVEIASVSTSTIVDGETAKGDCWKALEFPEESVPLQSHLYIERGRTECLCYQEVKTPGCLIRIKAPRQMGKSSLVNRILARSKAAGAKTVLLHFHQAEAAILTDVNRLLRWVCANLARQLNLTADLDDYWDDDLGSKMSCNLFLQSHILRQLDTPLVLAFEEVNELLAYPQVAQEFLTLIRFWHERAKVDEGWHLLRLMMVHSTEIYISLDVNQSPLNVGLSVSLLPFDLEQVGTLAKHHSLSLSETDIAQLHQFVGGHPYLTRLALYHLAQDDLSLEELLNTAATDVGIYHAHLHKALSQLQQVPTLEDTFRQVLASDRPIEVNQIDGFKLQSLGLIRLSPDGAMVSCRLYEQYFSGLRWSRQGLGLIVTSQSQELAVNSSQVDSALKTDGRISSASVGSGTLEGNQ